MPIYSYMRLWNLWGDIPYGVSFFPYALDIESDMDEYGGYDSDMLEELGFKECDTIKMNAFRFVYSVIH